MLGDTAVAVNPKDERYAHLVGRTVLLPLMQRAIPIVADEMVDRTFGTGAVKVTPAHDPNDFELGQRHQLPQILVIGKDAVMTAEAGAYAGLDRYEARARVVADLEAQGLLVKVEEYLEAKVPRCARCDSVLEPLPLEQWFVNMKPLAARAIEAITDGHVRYIPDRYTSIALEWLRNLRDWNISRQLWWGQRIPAWQCNACGGADATRPMVADSLSGSTASSPTHQPTNPPTNSWIVQLDPPDTCPRCGSNQLTQDPDVFDTWFSSGIWPQTVLGWPDATPELQRFFPTSLLSTARDILHLWVARMIMSSLDFCDQIPFHDVYVHPTILNWEGKRMSKSLGTGVDPLDLIAEYGADATRFGLLYMCSQTQDVRFTEERIEMARNFANKIWNASRFVLMNVEAAAVGGQDPSSHPATQQLSQLDLPSRWIRSRYARTVSAVNAALAGYEFDLAARTLYEFVWNEFCDWYVELVKPALRSDLTRHSSLVTLTTALEGTLRLLHPFMPFLTEEIWQRLDAETGRRGDQQSERPLPRAGEGGGEGTAEPPSLMVAAYPQGDESLFDDEGERAVGVFIETVRAMRNLRAEANAPTGKPVEVSLLCHAPSMRSALESMQAHFATLDTRATVTFIESASSKPSPSLSAAVGEVELFLSTAGLVDAGAERVRLTRERDRLTDYLAQLDRRLSDEKFIARAPAHVVEAERARRTEAQGQLQRIVERLSGLV